MRSLALLVALGTGLSLLAYFFDGEGAAGPMTQACLEPGSASDRALSPRDVAAPASATLEDVSPAALEPTISDEGGTAATTSEEGTAPLDSWLAVSGHIQDEQGAVVGEARVLLLSVKRGRDPSPLPREVWDIPLELRYDGVDGVATVVTETVTGPDGAFDLGKQPPPADGIVLTLVARRDALGRTAIGRSNLSNSEGPWPDTNVVLHDLLHVTIVPCTTGGAILDDALVNVTLRLVSENDGGSKDCTIERPATGGCVEVLVSPGSLSVVVTAPGRATGHRYAEPAADMMLPVALGVEATITGRVLSPDGAPVGSVSVLATGRYLPGESVRDEDTYDVTPVKTAPDGTFVLTGLAAGTGYWVGFHSPDKAHLTTWTDEVAAPSNLGDVTLERAGALDVVALGSAEVAPDSRWITLQYQNDDGTWYDTTSGDVRPCSDPTTLEGEALRLFPGRYRVWAGTSSLVGCSDPVDVLAGTRPTVKLRLGDSRTVTGRIVSVGGLPFNWDWNSSVWIVGSGLGRHSTSPHSSGAFSFDRVPETELTVRILIDRGEQKNECVVRLPAGVTDLGDIRVP